MLPRLTAHDLGLPEAVACPFCDGLETELHAGFGGQLSVVTYWCRHCRTPFDSFRPGAAIETGKKVPGAEK